MKARAVSTSVLAAALALAPLAWALPPAKGYKSSITSPTTATGATIKVNGSSKVQVKIGTGVVTFILKLKNVVSDDVMESPITLAGNTFEVVCIVNGVSKTLGFTFDLTAGNTDSTMTKYPVSLNDSGKWGSVLSPGTPIEIRQVRVIQGGGNGNVFGVAGLTTR